MADSIHCLLVGAVSESGLPHRRSTLDRVPLALDISVG